MKFKLIASLLLLTIVICSCTKKDNTPENIIGKWREAEIFNGYGNGGDFQWHAVTGGDLVEFKADLQYLDTNFQGKICIGTYSLLSKDEILINSNCYLAPFKFKIITLSQNTLVIEKPVIEGFLRYKYSRE